MGGPGLNLSGPLLWRQGKCPPGVLKPIGPSVLLTPSFGAHLGKVHQNAFQGGHQKAQQDASKGACEQVWAHVKAKANIDYRWKKLGKEVYQVRPRPTIGHHVPKWPPGPFPEFSREFFPSGHAQKAFGKNGQVNKCKIGHRWPGPQGAILGHTRKKPNPCLATGHQYGANPVRYLSTGIRLAGSRFQGPAHDVGQRAKLV